MPPPTSSPLHRRCLIPVSQFAIYLLPAHRYNWCIIYLQFVTVLCAPINAHYLLGLFHIFRSLHLLWTLRVNVMFFFFLLYFVLFFILWWMNRFELWFYCTFIGRTGVRMQGGMILEMTILNLYVSCNTLALLLWLLYLVIIVTIIVSVAVAHVSFFFHEHTNEWLHLYIWRKVSRTKSEKTERKRARTAIPTLIWMQKWFVLLWCTLQYVIQM